MKQLYKWLFWIFYTFTIGLVIMVDLELLTAKIYGFLEANLPDDLKYHGIEHTKDVLSVALELARIYNLNDEEIQLLAAAALLHDSGFIRTYSGHEEESCAIAKEVLPDYEFSDDQLEIICNLILATKVPQNPQTKLERILCDADLDYLGRPDFYETGRRLFEEFKLKGVVKDEAEWNKLQVGFLSAHRYHTDFSINNRESLKQEHLEGVKEIVAGYDQ